MPKNMPKQKKYKNLLKAAAANSSQDKSVATVNSSQDKSIASNASQVKFLVAANSSRDKSAAAANSSRDKSAASNSSRDKSAASNSSRDKSTAVASSSRDKLNFALNLAKRFLLQSLGKKWRENRIKLWNEFYDPRLSKTEIINNTPEDIALDQWALFVEYRLKPETQNLCKRNQEIWQKQIIPHTSGAKSIAIKRAELTEETEKEFSRVQMWDITHKKTDGSYVNEKAKEIALQALVSYIAFKEGGKIPVELAGMFPTQQISQGLDQESEIPSPRELGSRSSGASNKEA
ncbi:hypothetical protein Ahy_A02g008632 [Arachis hypogaea]|uniref:Uncharacterized protein n=1 Tax=Arachis hypogaea TaxID=3818 RepID=A0A445EF33_ARAHY|nr:hypothetical protein Ahy_A02g008632 [Arachis hypogaea]